MFSRPVYLPDGVTVAQQSLNLLVMVRIHVRQPPFTSPEFFWFESIPVFLITSIG